MKHQIFVGFDGFIDSLLRCVEKRLSKNSCLFFKKMESFSDRIKNTAPKNMNFECIELFQSPGGNAPLLAQGLSSLGAPTYLVGCLGYPSILPLFKSLHKKNLSLRSIADPGKTDALEFDNGKIFLGKMGELGSLSLTKLFKRVPSLNTAILKSSCLATVNWTMMPLVEEFWSYLLSNPSLLAHKPYIFVDLADPAKKSDPSIKKALSLLRQLNAHTPVILGLNKAESEKIGSLYNVFLQNTSLSDRAQLLQKKLHISTILIHTTNEVAAATSSEKSHHFVPLDPHPFRSTGAGDTFNAGFLFSFLQKKNLSEALREAIAASGIFIRTGIPPTQKAMRTFLRLLDTDPLLINKKITH